MATKSMPQIPPRPMRSQDPNLHMAAERSLGSDIPMIPPRPINRRLDRSPSPHRDSYARSPFNEPSFIPGSFGKTNAYTSGSTDTLGADLPRRPSSVALPSLGQEGNEYADVFEVQDDLASSPPQTRSVANDLHLHAPKPSLPVSSAKERVSAVTRTDSSQAAAHGIGRATADDIDPHIRSLKTKASFSSERSTGTDRRPSSSENNEVGPDIGQRVPMYPNAGFVQAPSPSPYATQFPAGIGFHNDGSKPRNHGRRVSGPPGSYGLHGHGIIPKDRFEQAYYDKHPELLKKETGHYSGAIGDGRGEWALSSEDLNRIVRDTAVGKANSIGTPHEEIGFLASEEYISRKSSPHPPAGDSAAHPHPSQLQVGSPLRKSSFPAESSIKAEVDGAALRQRLRGRSDAALDSEFEDDGVVHVGHSNKRISQIYSGTGIESTENLSPYPGSVVDDGDDHGYTAPILAADEVAKDPFAHELQPAVLPPHSSHGYDNEHLYHFRTGSQSSLPGSKASSRPTSVHGVIPGFHHERESLSTPLEDLAEYEPLFPDDPKTVSSTEKPRTAAEKVKKRPDILNRRFPSQDVWEDAPNSVHHTATVSTPQAPEEQKEDPTKELYVRPGETPEQAFARRQEELAEIEFVDTDSFLNPEKKPWEQQPHLVMESRPGLKQRFPSRDIWEDSPDSLHLQTTVSAPQVDEREILSPPDERPTTGAVVYHQEKSAAGLPLGEEEGRATTGIAATMRPHIPARPVKKTSLDSVTSQSPPVIPQRPQKLQSDIPPIASVVSESSPTGLKDKPALPERAKPQVPARPARPISKESSEGAPLTKTISGSSVKSIGSDSGVTAKAKPPVPSRPVGSKIAALQSGFMSDLNKRLQLGPQVPKKEEPAPEEVVEEQEKAPLADARKGRARGPVRRAPAKSPTPDVVSAPSTSGLSFSMPSTLWQIHPDDGTLKVMDHEIKAIVPETKTVESSVPVVVKEEPEKLIHQADVVPEAEHAALEDKSKPDILHVADKNSSPASKATETIADDGDDENYEQLSGSTATIKPIKESIEDVEHMSTLPETDHTVAGTEDKESSLSEERTEKASDDE